MFLGPFDTLFSGYYDPTTQRKSIKYAWNEPIYEKRTEIGVWEPIYGMVWYDMV